MSAEPLTTEQQIAALTIALQTLLKDNVPSAEIPIPGPSPGRKTLAEIASDFRKKLETVDNSNHERNFPILIAYLEHRLELHMRTQNGVGPFLIKMDYDDKLDWDGVVRGDYTLNPNVAALVEKWAVKQGLTLQCCTNNARGVTYHFDIKKIDPDDLPD